MVCGGDGTWFGLIVIALSCISVSENCKYPNLNMKFDIRKIVERKYPYSDDLLLTSYNGYTLSNTL